MTLLSNLNVLTMNVILCDAKRVTPFLRIQKKKKIDVYDISGTKNLLFWILGIVPMTFLW